MPRETLLTTAQARYAKPLSSLSLAPGAVLFCDFDGPFVDVSQRYYSTYQLGLADTQAAYQAKGITLPICPLSKAQFWRLKQNRTADEVIAHWSGLENEQIPFFLERVQQIVNQPALLHQDSLQTGLHHAVHLLKHYGIRLVVVTLRHSAQVMQILHDAKLAQSISEVYGTSEAEMAYANRSEHKTALLEQAIAEQNTLPYQTCMIGDTEADLIAGQTLGVPTVALTCGIRSQSYLQAFNPTCLYPNLLSAVEQLLCPHETLQPA
ncbi:HAD family hydrolase [Almyronema epifaneia]|uniref:HAD family hydrolase n=1 Tax=Almyronema epifaneia S1 TaxID=2991925 RepID=A0ABW6IBT2_9CYAN